MALLVLVLVLVLEKVLVQWEMTTARQQMMWLPLQAQQALQRLQTPQRLQRLQRHTWLWMWLRMLLC